MIGIYGVSWNTGPSSYVSGAGQSGRMLAVSRAQPQATDTPVTPVTPARPVSREQPSAVARGVELTGPAAAPGYRQGADPAELAIRGRIQYVNPDELTAQAQKGASAQEVMEEGECQTCKERKYQDGSDDPGVSFKTPTNLTPEQAASAVRGHEMEHVVREQAKAQREDREVVSQSVTYHNAICPECGKVYVSGGTTRTSTRAAEEPVAADPTNQGRQTPFFAVA